MGILLIIALGVLTDWTIRLIVLNAKMSGQKNSYIDIMDYCFGRTGRALVSFFQFTFALGGMMAFCVILGDTIPHVLQYVIPATDSSVVNFLISRNVVIAVMTMGVSFPLSLYRDIEKLSKASAISLVSYVLTQPTSFADPCRMCVIVVTVALRGPGVELALKGSTEARWTFINTGVFEAIGVISFAFVCHHNSLLIYSSLRTPSLDNFARVTHISTVLSVIACLAIVSGFLVFTDKTQGNILNNFSADDVWVNIARACVGPSVPPLSSRTDGSSLG